MTVTDLIEKLKTMPPDAIVIYDRYSEAIEMEPEEVDFIPASARQMIKRNGIWMRFRPEWWDSKDGEPVFKDLCHFPGN